VIRRARTQSRSADSIYNHNIAADGTKSIAIVTAYQSAYAAVLMAVWVFGIFFDAGEVTHLCNGDKTEYQGTAGCLGRALLVFAIEECHSWVT